MGTFMGIAASKGIGMGKAVVIKETYHRKQLEDRKVAEPEIEKEIKRAKDALDATEQNIRASKEKADGILSGSEIQVFDAHIMVLRDPIFNELVEETIKSGSFCAEAAVIQAVDKIKAMFMAINNDYMRQRADDVEHVGQSVVNKLLAVEMPDLSRLDSDTIIIAKDLTPADTVSLDRKHVKGFAIEKGGETSHTAIMARAMEIPALVGCGPDIANIASGDYIILDGDEAAIFQNPEEAMQREYSMKYLSQLEERQQLGSLKDLPAATSDGVRVELAGNIAKPEEAHEVLEKGGDGIGLFRTEFLYLDRDVLPSEEEQFEAYRKAAQVMGDRSCIIRTMDIGGDKKLPCLHIPEEKNPFLGYRAIRICLRETDLFKTQLRAILRASAYGNLKIMFPMISHIAELRLAKAILEEVKAELNGKSIPYNKEIQVGVMIEVPAAALISDLLAREADFFSIGTNDLCQYTLAVDRMNEQISSLYEPLHTGVLRLIKQVITAAHHEGIKVGMCGEMASKAEYAVLLLGLGLDEFSMAPAAIPSVKNMLRSISFEKAKRIAEQVMGMEESVEIIKYLKEELHAV